VTAKEGPVQLAAEDSGQGDLGNASTSNGVYCIDRVGSQMRPLFGDVEIKTLGYPEVTEELWSTAASRPGSRRDAGCRSTQESAN